MLRVGREASFVGGKHLSPRSSATADIALLEQQAVDTFCLSQRPNGRISLL
jgi:hypothetical protein